MVIQHKAYGLGNFINLTPTIKAMYDKLGQKIPVYFESDYVKQCYLKSKYIEIVDNVNRPLFGSNEINQEMPDWEFVFDKFWEQLNLSNVVPHTFIDEPKGEKHTVVIANGSANHLKCHKKLYDNELTTVISYLVNNNIDVVFVGSLEDYIYSKAVLTRFNIQCVIENIRQCLGLIKGCDIFVSNGTGFYHAAGAMRKNQVIFWRNCNQIKNRNPNHNQMAIDLYDKNRFKTFQNYMDKQL